MQANDFEAILERVRSWPKERQDEVTEILLEMERQDLSSYRLTDDQADEVSRIRGDVCNAPTSIATDEELAALWKSCGL